MTVVTMLGAGSGFTAPLMRDIMLIPGMDQGEIRLVDIDTKRLAQMQALIGVMAKRLKGDAWKVSSTTDRKKALRGSHYIVNCIEVSGLHCVRFDNDIPLQYGVDQCVGDTIGPGGIFKALRTVPVWIDILHDIEQLCPKALVLNYTNPMSMMILAAVRNTSAQVVGLCHSVQGSTRELAQVAEIPYDEMVYRCAGVNHLAWITELSHHGRNLYPRIFERVRKESAIYEQNPVRFELMLQFGAFVTESSGHVSEYVPYFRKTPETLRRYCRDGSRGGSSTYADSWPAGRAQQDQRRAELIKDITKMDLARGFEYASDIIEAHAFNRLKTIYGNVANRGLIDNLLPDGVVEVKVLVDEAGFQPCRFGALPPQMAALCRSHQAVYDLVVRGIMEKDREAIVHAMLLDPLTAAVCGPAEIREMTERLAAAEKDYIPTFMSKGLTLPTGYMGDLERFSKRKLRERRAAQAKHFPRFEATGLLPASGDIRAVKLPGKDLVFSPVPGVLGDGCNDIRKIHNGKDGLVYLRSSALLARAGAGYFLYGPDAPFKAWVNGKEIGCDEHCSNPGCSGKYRAAVKWKKGRNEVVMAMHTNHGNSWGVIAQYSYV
ncbi:MAG: alpha-glucosidase/alpha-galactosidase [bacterium]